MIMSNVIGDPATGSWSCIFCKQVVHNTGCSIILLPSPLIYWVSKIKNHARFSNWKIFLIYSMMIIKAKLQIIKIDLVFEALFVQELFSIALKSNKLLHSNSMKLFSCVPNIIFIQAPVVKGFEASFLVPFGQCKLLDQKVKIEKSFLTNPTLHSDQH